MKYKLNLFEQPYTDRTLQQHIGSPEHRDLARQAVRESLVLLKNENTTLPLKKNQNITVVGPWANSLGAQCGGWTIDWQGALNHSIVGTTILEGLQQLASLALSQQQAVLLMPMAMDADAQIMKAGRQHYDYLRIVTGHAVVFHHAHWYAAVIQETQ